VLQDRPVLVGPAAQALLAEVAATAVSTLLGAGLALATCCHVEADITPNPPARPAHEQCRPSPRRHSTFDDHARSSKIHLANSPEPSRSHQP
jgi:hypothetical protein